MGSMPLGIVLSCGYFIILGALGLLVVFLYGQYGVEGNIVASVMLLFPAYLLLTKSKHARELSVVVITLSALLAMGSGQRTAGLILALIVLYLLFSGNVKAYYESP